MKAWVEDSVALAQAFPEVMDSVNPNEVSKVMAKARRVPARVLRDDSEVEEMQAQRKQQEQMAQAAQTAQPAASAIKDIAQAQSLS